MFRQNARNKIITLILAALMCVSTLIPFNGSGLLLNAHAAMYDMTLTGTEINTALKNLVLDAEEPYASTVLEHPVKVSVSVEDLPTEESYDAPVEIVDLYTAEEQEYYVENQAMLSVADPVYEEPVQPMEAQEYIPEPVQDTPAQEPVQQVPEQVQEPVQDQAVQTPAVTLIDDTPAQEEPVYTEPVYTEPVQEPAQEPVQEPAQEPVQEPVQEPAQEAPANGSITLIDDTVYDNGQQEQQLLQEQPVVVTEEGQDPSLQEEIGEEEAKPEQVEQRKHESTVDTVDYYIQAIKWSTTAPAADTKTVPLSYNGKLVAWYVSGEDAYAYAQSIGNTGFTAYDTYGNSTWVSYDFVNTVYLYYYKEGAWDVPYFDADMSNAFRNMKSLYDISALKYIHSDYVQNMSYMFAGDTYLSDISALGSFNTDSLTNVSYMFMDCPYLYDVSCLDAHVYDLVNAEQKENAAWYLGLVGRYIYIEDASTFPIPYNTNLTYYDLSDAEKGSYPYPYSAWNMSSFYADGIFYGTSVSVYPDWYYYYLGLTPPVKATAEPEITEEPVQEPDQREEIQQQQEQPEETDVQESGGEDLQDQTEEENNISEDTLEEVVVLDPQNNLVDEELVEVTDDPDAEDGETIENGEEEKTEEPQAEDKTDEEEDEQKEDDADSLEEKTSAELVVKSEGLETYLVGVDVQGLAAVDTQEAIQTLQRDAGLDIKTAADVSLEIENTGMRSTKLMAKGNRAGDPPYAADDTEISTLTAKWITADTIDNGDPDLLYIKPSGKNPQEVRMQINYALSGEHNYAPGDIVITVPAHMIYNRSGRDEGVFIIPYPEDPSTKQDFNWKLIGDQYVLTNTKAMSAATKGYIQFAITNIDPISVVDMQESQPFDAYIEVITHKGTLIARRSNSLTVEFDTEARVTSTSKRQYNDVQWISADQVPTSQQVAGETQYIKVNWYVWGYTTSNTRYDLQITDSMPDEYNGFILNATEAGGQSTIKVDSNLATDGKSSYYYYSTIYPASQFQPGVEYTFHNTVEFKVTEVDPEVGNDPQLVTTQTASAEVVWSYELPEWENPTGHFMVHKIGNDGKTNKNYTHRVGYGTKYSYSDLNRRSDGYYGFYGNGVNRLRDGNDIDLSYTIESIGYIMPWTYDPVAPVTEESARILSNYGRKEVTITTTDAGVSISRYGEKMTVLQDYEFVSVEFPRMPYVYKAEPHNINPDGSFTAVSAGDGTFLYQIDDDYTGYPDIQLQIYRNGNWEDWATASWTTGSLIITMADNTTSTDTVVNLPSNTENFRTVVTLANAGIVYDIRPVIRLKSTQTMQYMMDYALSKNSTPSFLIYNSVDMDFKMTESGAQIGEILKDGYDQIQGYTTDIMAVPTKTGATSIADADYENRWVKIHYKGVVEEQSVISLPDVYRQAVADGYIQSETHGIWYDLLPKNVIPDLSTVRLRENDSITDIYTIEDYKGSGRTLLVVEADLVNTPTVYTVNNVRYYEDKITIEFDATYDFESLKDLGYTVHNVIAFESSNSSIGNVTDYMGEPDDPTSSNNIATVHAFANGDEIAWMTNLDPNRDDPSFLYAGDTTTFDTLEAARTSLSKDVQVNNDGNWGTGVYGQNPDENKKDVYTGGNYVYRLRMMSDASTISKNMVLYDSLENYVAVQGNDDIDIGAASWKGYFNGIDVSQLEAAGCAPVVYYSTVANLTIEIPQGNNSIVLDPVNGDLSNTSVWTPAASYTGDLSAVKAIAIDASKDPNGDDFILQPMESVVVYVKMRAPSGAEATGYINADAHAYNNAYLNCTSLDADGPQTGNDTYLIRKDYTKVGLNPYTYTVTKVWDDDDNRDGIRPGSITFTLYRDGVSTGLTANVSEANPIGKFENIDYCDPDGNKYHYQVVETEVEGYTASYSIEGTDVTYTNTHVPEKITIPGTKTWIGDTEADRPTNITVKLYKNGEFLMQKVVSAPWTYEFADLFKYEDGNEIVYTIEEVLVGKGMSYVPTIDDYDIVNTFNPYGNLVVSKTVTNTTEQSEDTLFPFRFSFTKTVSGETMPVIDTFNYEIKEGDTVVSSGTVQNNDTISLKGGQTVYIYDIPEYTDYKVEEEQQLGFTLTSSSNASGQIRPNTTATASFTNTYSSKGQINVTVKKRLADRELIKYQFKFDMYNEDGDVIKSASNGIITDTVRRADETIEYTEAEAIFGALKYTQDDSGQLFTYTIKERDTEKPGYTYDDTEYMVYIAPLDNGDGTMNIRTWYLATDSESTGNNITGEWWLGADPITPAVPAGYKLVDEAEFIFHNSYAAEGELEMRAWKDMRGRALSEGEFTFRLLDEDGNILDTKTNAADGSILFDPVQFDQSNIGGTYYYLIEEVKGNDDTINYDDSVYGYAVTVADNGDGTLSFVQETVNVDDLFLECEDCYGTGIEGGFKVDAQVLYYDTPSMGFKLTLPNGLTAEQLAYALRTEISDEDATVLVLNNSLSQYSAMEIQDLSGEIVNPPVIATISTQAANLALRKSPLDAESSSIAFDISSEILAQQGGATPSESAFSFYIIPTSEETCDTCGGSGRIKNPDYEAEEGELPVFVNTLKDGGLSISKFVTNAEQADPAQQFHFKVKLIGDGIEDGTIEYDLQQAVRDPHTNPEDGAYTITWLDHDSTVLATTYYNAGLIPRYPGTDPVRENYVFTGWTPTVTEVSGNTSYMATYEAE